MCSIVSISADETLPIRKKVLWPDLELADLALPEDATALHLGLFLGDTLIGVGSFFPDGKRYRLRKLAVDQASQGKGYGARLVKEGMKRLGAQGINELYCDVRVTATSFYQRLGFEVFGEEFDKNGVMYRKATRQLVP